MDVSLIVGFINIVALKLGKMVFRRPTGLKKILFFIFKNVLKKSLYHHRTVVNTRPIITDLVSISMIEIHAFYLTMIEIILCMYSMYCVIFYCNILFILFTDGNNFYYHNFILPLEFLSLHHVFNNYKCLGTR